MFAIKRGGIICRIHQYKCTYFSTKDNFYYLLFIRLNKRPSKTKKGLNNEAFLVMQIKINLYPTSFFLYC